MLVVLFIADRAIYQLLHTLDKDIYTGLAVGKINSFLKRKDTVDVLVFGSSRAAHHVDLTTLSTANFNAGQDATKIGFASALVATLKKKGQTILVHIDHDVLYATDYDGQNDAQLLAFHALKNDEIARFFDSYFKEESTLGKISHSYAANGKILSIIKNRFVKGHDYAAQNGYEPLVPTEEQAATFQQILDKNGPGQNTLGMAMTKVNPKSEMFIDYIVRKAQKNDSKLIFFTSPSLLKVDMNVKDRTKTFFETKNIPYWDHGDFFKSLVYTDWKDETHLSDKGAKEYSKYLITELLPYVESTAK